MNKIKEMENIVSNYKYYDEIFKGLSGNRDGEVTMCMMVAWLEDDDNYEAMRLIMELSQQMKRFN